MQRHQRAFAERGARVVAVAQGTGDEAAHFCRRLGTDLDCLGDPGRAAFARFSLPRDSWWNVTARPFLEEPGLAFDRIRRASLRGSLMKHTDVLQLGGVVVVDGAGVIRFLYRSRRTDDWPDTADVLAALDAL